MKILSLIFATALISISSFAQIPGPTNLTFSFQYNGQGSWLMVCNGEDLPQWHYCSYFSWEHADTLHSTLDFSHYTLSCVNVDNTEDTIVLATTVDNYIELDFGLLGWAWVTAVYVNPDNESLPSNVIENMDLPISVSELDKLKEPKIVVNSKNNSIRLQNNELVNSIYVYDLYGREVMQLNSFSGDKQIYLTKGIYLAEIIRTDNKIITQKIML